MSDRILVIAGMHRSGTSMISNWLFRSGLQIGERLMAPGIGNIEGHFEDIDFFRYHEDVLEDNHLPKSGYVNRPIQILTRYQQEKLNHLITFKCKMHEQWGWKEPRTCLFLTHYRKIIPDAYYIIVIRNYHSTINSLINRDFKIEEQKYLSGNWLSRQAWIYFRQNRRKRKLYCERSVYYLNVWLTYSKELLKHAEILNPEKFVIVDYSSLCTDDIKVFSILKYKWCFSLEYFDFKKIFKESFISKVINIENFITDKSLLNAADDVENKLKNLQKTSDYNWDNQNFSWRVLAG